MPDDLPDFHYRVVRPILPAMEDCGYTVVIAFPNHPDWWRIVARFFGLDRAEEYARQQNELGHHHHYSEAMAEPEDAPGDPGESRARRAEENAREASRRAATLEKQVFDGQAAIRDIADQRLAMQARAIAAEQECNKLVGDNEHLQKAVADLEEKLRDRRWAEEVIERHAAVDAAATQAVLEVIEEPETTGSSTAAQSNNDDLQTLLGNVAFSTLKALEEFYDEGRLGVRNVDLMKKGILQGSLTRAIQVLEKNGYARSDNTYQRFLVKRADGTPVSAAGAPPLTANEVKESAPTLAAANRDDDKGEAGEVEDAGPDDPSSTKEHCAWCFNEIPEDRNGRFCSNECAALARSDEERQKSLRPRTGDVEIVTGATFKDGPLPPPKFNSPFSDAGEALRRKAR